MTVNTPSVIASENNAVAALNGGDDGLILLHFAGWDADNKKIWENRIFDDDHKEIGSDNELRTTENADAFEAMSSLLSFLGAAAEARDESSENWTLFIPAVRDWAKINSDELAMIQVEIEAEQELLRNNI